MASKNRFCARVCVCVIIKKNLYYLNNEWSEWIGKWLHKSIYNHFIHRHLPTICISLLIRWFHLMCKQIIFGSIVNTRLYMLASHSLFHSLSLTNSQHWRRYTNQIKHITFDYDPCGRAIAHTLLIHHKNELRSIIAENKSIKKM